LAIFAAIRRADQGQRHASLLARIGHEFVHVVLDGFSCLIAQSGGNRGSSSKFLSVRRAKDRWSVERPSDLASELTDHPFGKHALEICPSV